MARRLPPCWIALSPGVLEQGASDGAAATLVDAFVHAADVAVTAGLRGILLREPALEDGLFLRLALALRELLSAPGVGGWLGLHDRLHLVDASGADAGHVGGRSLPVTAARRVLGPDVALGVSTHAGDLDEVSAGADFTLHAPVFQPLSKGQPVGQSGGAEPAPPASSVRQAPQAPQAQMGLDGLAAFVERCQLPVWALGGVTAEGLADLRGSGAAGACTIGAVWGTTQAPITSQRSALGDLDGIGERARALARASAAAFSGVPQP